MSRRVVFVDGARTAFGKIGGSLRDYYPVQLAAAAVRGLLEKTQLIERGGQVDCLFAGAAAGDASTFNPARYIALSAGLPIETSASFIEMQCGSAIDCINHAAWKILCGAADVIIAGGMESHSQHFVKFGTAVQPYKMIAPHAIEQVMSPVAADNISMIEISDNMAEKWSISREECDFFAARSQQRAGQAIEKGCFKDEIVPIVIPATRKQPEIIVDKDEHVRPNTTTEILAKLRPVRPGGVTTAGNASGLNDGAAFVLMMTEEKAKELGYTPYMAWVTGADCGVDPKLMGIGPAYSNLLAIRRAGLRVRDLGLFECNEAFAAQNLAVIREMELQSGDAIHQEIWNPNGGAIAFGHPNGASGARIAIFTMKQLERSGARYGVFGSCCGGGLGVSALVENLRL